MSAPAEAGASAGPGRALSWALVGAATFTMAVSYVDRQTLAVLAPTVCQALSIDDEAYGVLVSAFSIAYLAGAPLSGAIVDRVGARRGLLVAVLVWSAVAASHAMALGFASLFALRIALGLAESPSFPGATQTIHRVLPLHEQPRAFGILFTGSSFGAMVAPPLASWLSGRFGFRAAFLGSALVGLVWVPIWLGLAFRRGSRAALDRAPAQDRPARSPSFLAILTRPAALRGLCVIVASAPLLGFLLNWGSKYLVLHHGVSQADVGGLLWAPPLLFDLGAVGFGSLASRHARRTGFAAPRALLAAACALALVAALLPIAGSAAAATLVMGVAMAGGGGLYAIATADMLARVPSETVSRTSGLSAAAQSLALIASSPLVGRVAKETGSYQGSAVGLALWVLPGCVAWLLWRPPPPARNPTTP